MSSKLVHCPEVNTQELPMNPIEQAKSNSQYRLAGQLAFLAGQSDYYGCHFGMRSTKDQAVSEFKAAWLELDQVFRGK